MSRPVIAGRRQSKIAEQKLSVDCKLLIHQRGRGSNCAAWAQWWGHE